MKTFVARVVVSVALTMTAAAATGTTAARADDCELSSADCYWTADTDAYGTGDSYGGYTVIGSMDYGTDNTTDGTSATGMYYIGCPPSTAPCLLTTGLGGQ